LESSHVLKHMVDLDDDFQNASNDWAVAPSGQLGQRGLSACFWSWKSCCRYPRTAIWRDFRAQLTPAYSPNSRHLFCCHRCGFFSIASFVGHGHGPLVGRLRALALSCLPPTESSPCKVGALQQAKHPCTSTNVIQRTCAD
jgi:hypothetical protein